MAQKDPNSVAQKWATNLANAGAAYEAGIRAVTTPPGQLAAANADKWAANVAAAKPRFASKSASVGLADWQNQAITKGAPRLVDGASTAQPKMASFLNTFLPTVYQIVGTLPAGGTYAQNKARAVAFMDALHAKKGTF